MNKLVFCSVGVYIYTNYYILYILSYRQYLRNAESLDWCWRSTCFSAIMFELLFPNCMMCHSKLTDIVPKFGVVPQNGQMSNRVAPTHLATV